MSWFWKSDLRHTDGKEGAWTAYEDDVVAKIERAFQKKQKTMTLDETYKIDFKEMIQHRKDDRNRQRPIKRVAVDGLADLQVVPAVEKAEQKQQKLTNKKRKQPESASAAAPDANNRDELAPKRRAVEEAAGGAAIPVPVPNVPVGIIANVISKSLGDEDALAARLVDKDWAQGVALPNVQILALDPFPSAVELPKLLSKTHSIHYEAANDADASAFFQALLHNSTVSDLRFNAAKIDANRLKDLMDVLSQNKNVASVSFEGLGVHGAQIVAASLGANESIKGLKIVKNDIKEEGFNAICDALTVNRTLETLDLSENDLESVNTSHLGDAMRRNSTLRKLSLRGCRIFGGFVDFFASLAQNHGLTELDYYFNDCEIEGLEKLLDALKTNNSLTKLGLGANGLGRQGSSEAAQSAFRRLFTEHPSITHIDLESCDIEDDLAVDICGALAQNKTLKFLNFKLNTLTDDEISAFARAIAKHPTLETLKLQSTDGMMTNESLKVFLEALKTNKALLYLGLEDCDEDPDGDMAKIRAILEQRHLGKLQVGESEDER